MSDATCASTTSTIAPRAMRAGATDYSQPTTPVPMPGRLPVRHWHPTLRQTFDTTVDQVPVGEMVVAQGTVETVVRLDRAADSRMAIVLADSDGESVHVTLSADVAGMAYPVLVPGARLMVRGVVVRPLETQPVSIDGLGVREVDV